MRSIGFEFALDQLAGLEAGRVERQKWRLYAASDQLLAHVANLV